MKPKHVSKKLLLNKKSIATLDNRMMRVQKGGTELTDNCTNPVTHAPCDTRLNSCLPCIDYPGDTLDSRDTLCHTCEVTYCC